MIESTCKFGMLIRRATNGGAVREYLFVCPTGVKYMDGRFVAGLPGGVIGDSELMA